MSDSIPGPIPVADETAAAGLASGLPGASSPRWWAASIAFHAMLLTWLLFFSPVRVFDPHAKPEVSHVSTAQAKEVVEQIREKQAGSIRENVRTLQRVAAQIAELEKGKRADFTEFAREMRKEGPGRAAAEQKSIAGTQAEALAAFDGIQKDQDLFVRVRAGAYFDNMADQQERAAEIQARILRMQEEAVSLLSMGDGNASAALTAQTEAMAAQDRAAKALVEVEAARNPSRWSRKRTAHEGQIEHYTYHLKMTRDAVTNSDANLAKIKSQIAFAEAVSGQTKISAGKAAAKALADRSEKARLLMENTQKTAARAQRNLDSLRKRLVDAPKALEDARKRLPELEAKVAQLLAEPDPDAIPPSAEDRALVTLQATARQLQLEAGQAQERAAQAVAAIRPASSESVPDADVLAPLDQALSSAPASASADIDRMDLAQLYESAVQTEKALTQSYRRLRATDLAMIRHMPLSKSIELTEVAKAIRPDLKSALQSSVESGEQALAARQAVQSARTEVGAMVQLANSLFMQAQSMAENQGASISMGDYHEKFEQWEKMEDMASEDAGEWARDLTGAMGGGAANGEGSPGDGSRGSGGPGKGGQSSGDAGSDATGGMPDLGRSGVKGPFGGTGAGGSGGTGESEGSGFGGFGLGGIAQGRGGVAAPLDVSQTVHALPGRRVAARGPSADWLFVDSWYVLGPFDNTDRRNIERKFPPETIIDLNAAYPGKNGVPIHWEFFQSGKPNIVPPLDAYNAAVQNPSLSQPANVQENLQYIIYYAYTELWFEQACDLWVAIGSDDYSKAWVEDQLIWASGKRLKPWRLNEGIRKVHFKPGINRILFRVENGDGPTQFSFVVSFRK